MKRITLAIASLLCGWVSLAQAQNAYYTVPAPAIIATGNTFQQIVAAGEKKSLTIQNNNASDSCNIIIGGPWVAGDTTSTSRTINGTSITGAKASISLPAGGSYTRYFPYIPKDLILGTCAATGDSIYVDTQ